MDLTNPQSDDPEWYWNLDWPDERKVEFRVLACHWELSIVSLLLGVLELHSVLRVWRKLYAKLQ